MIRTICLETKSVLFLIVIFGFIVYMYHQHITNIRIKPLKCKPCKKVISNSNNINYSHQKRHQSTPNTPAIDGYGRYVDPVRIQDNKDLLDPYRFPEKRLDRHNLFLKNIALNYKAYGLHTQGYPDSPILRGYLYENKQSGSEKRILPLFGYETYPTSGRFKYYTVLGSIGLYISPKIEIEYIVENGNRKEIKYRELYDDDVVIINKLEDTKFTVRLLDTDEIRQYSPY